MTGGSEVPLTEIGENVFVASRGVHLVGAEAMNVDGGHERVVVAEIHGQWNRAGGGVEPDSVRVMFFEEGADRMSGGLRLAVENIRAADDPRPPDVLDGWLDSARFICQHVRHDEKVAPVSRLIDQLAESTGVFLDPATLRTMAFTLAAIQAAHLTTTDLTPDDPGFGDHIVAALGVFTAALVDRIDGNVP
jgi:hypothetical protein